MAGYAGGKGSSGKDASGGIFATLTRVLPPLPSTERGAFCNISADPSGERILYCSGNNVIWRNVETALKENGAEGPDDVYCSRTHAVKVTCAAMSPNGNWVVSGDEKGAIRIWGAKGDHILKNEFQLWNGVISDVGWADESKRIVACGDGAQTRAAAIIWDTGSKTGEVGGHTKKINAIAIRNQRPFRIATGSEDTAVNFHEGPPFKFKCSYTGHSNFVNSVRYAPDGDTFASVGSDTKVCLFDGKTGELIKEFAKPDGIAGSLWACSFAPDSKHLATAGGDKKIRVWDCTSGTQTAEAAVGTGALEDMQVGLCWAATGNVVSVCLDGRLLVWDKDLKCRTIDGPQGPQTSLAIDSSGTCLAGGADGSICILPGGKPVKRVKIGKNVQHILGKKGGTQAMVISMDDSVRCLDTAAGKIVGDPVKICEFAVGACWVDEAETMLCIASAKKNLHLVSGGKIVGSAAVARRPTACAAAAGKVAVAIEAPDEIVNGIRSEQFEIALYEVAGESIKISSQAALQKHKVEICALAFTTSGDMLASGDASGKIFVWGADGAIKIDAWTFHTARISSLSWFPDGKKLISGSLDQNIFVWNSEDPGKRLKITEVHRGGVTAVVGSGDGTISSVGHDGFFLQHKIA